MRDLFAVFAFDHIIAGRGKIPSYIKLNQTKRHEFKVHSVQQFSPHIAAIRVK